MDSRHPSRALETSPPGTTDSFAFASLLSAELRDECSRADWGFFVEAARADLAHHLRSAGPSSGHQGNIPLIPERFWEKAIFGTLNWNA